MEFQVLERAVNEDAVAVKIAANGVDDGLCVAREILVMDEDSSAVGHIEELLLPKGCSVRVYATIDELVDAAIQQSHSCLILGESCDGGRSGFEVLVDLRRRNWEIPIVLMAKCWNVELVVDAMRAGADGFVPRPCDSKKLLEALGKALEGGRHIGFNNGAVCGARALLSSLHYREREVVRLAVAGLINKEIANQMGLALVTVKVYRARAMKKLGAGNAAELAKIATLGGLHVDMVRTKKPTGETSKMAIQNGACNEC